ncbi:ParB/RepB/Spo0J family partition protein [Chitinilyticum piscinae]|uniref:ParB/RepB/Spo0J family partition protein n=1 Tax=Chitinilyticum piscinae TaxID=2866724 RepID=A0A8J7FK27_9NEIS|nr:ParB/RepB/Spo0J family partition protein [Chitinilyticum piscinae]MBE9610870.1 ParB/RepB/Spo0J family partition protein [Chitinilyticum piscinae]
MKGSMFSAPGAAVTPNPDLVPFGAKPGQAASPRNGTEVATEIGDEAVLDLRIDTLISNPYNSRHTYDSSEYQQNIIEMAESLDHNGQLSPILVTQLTDELRELIKLRGDEISAAAQYVVIDGETRLRALRHSAKLEATQNPGTRMPTIRAIVRLGLLPKDLYELAFVANEQRKGHNDVDRAIGWRRVLDENVYKDATDLAAALGVSDTLISLVMSFWQVPEEVRSFAKACPSVFSAPTLGEIRNMQNQLGSDKAIELAMAVMDRKLSQRAVKAEKTKMISAHRAAATRYQGYQYDGRGENGLHVKAKEKSVGRIDISLIGVSEDVRDKLARFLEELAPEH